MEQTSYIHRILKKRSKKANWCYMSSILMRNKDVPLFEEYFGQLDYDWLLRTTKHRKCIEVPPCVIVYEKNLSKNPEYRKRDFYMGLLEVDGDLRTMKRWYSSRARYFYVAGNTKMARHYFFCGVKNWKTVLYYISSFSGILRRLIIKKFKVFG